MHLSFNTGAEVEHECKLQIERTLSKSRLPCLERCLFPCILLCNNMISLAISCNRRKDKSSECQSFFEAYSSSLVTAPKADTFDNEVLREKMPLCKVEI